MNTDQKLLLEKTLAILGWLGVVLGGGLILALLIINGNDPYGSAVKFLDHILRLRGEGLFIWVCLGGGGALLWIRAFLRAGRLGG